MNDLTALRPRKPRVDAGPAASWAADVQASLRRSRRLAWTVAGVAGGLALVEAIALAVMAPLKTVVPYTILVDRQTGQVETVRGQNLEQLPQNQAVTEASLIQYVIARETFDATDLRENYRKVTLSSEGPAKAEYAALMARSNPASPLNLYSPTTMLSVAVKSVSLLTPTTALVRFDAIRQEPGGGAVEQRPYTSVIAFRYTGAPARPEDRFLNPLGFQVTRYRRDAETPVNSVVRVPAAPQRQVVPVLPTTVVAVPAAPPPNVTVNVAPAGSAPVVRPQ